MITYKPIIIPGGRRRDGTWPVKIRITFKGVSRRLPTTLVCTDADITRGGKIKNATVLEKANELITRMRATTTDLSPFTLDVWDVDQVVEHIRGRLSAQDFRLDFFSYADEVISGKIQHTKAYYQTALNALEKYIGRRTLDVNAITRKMLLGFAEEIGEVRAARHLAKLAYIHRCAREQYNDEDAGVIRIPRQPFQNLPKIKPQGKGQKALTAEVFQQIIDTEPANEWERIALAAFFLSFCTAGANMADLYAQKKPVGEVWCYRRAKTGVYVETALHPVIDTFLNCLQDVRTSPWWLPALHRYGSADTATHNVNKWLKEIADRLGLEKFTFYAARKTWATQARRLGIEKATIDDALAHIGSFKMADIYAEKNWDLTQDANEKVIALFMWDKNRTIMQDTAGNLPAGGETATIP